MSRMSKTTRSRRLRRRFDDDFKAQAVRLVLDEGKTVGAVARDLDLTETALREWVKRAQADRTHGRTGLKRWVYGSVAEKVLRSAPCSMMIIRSPSPELN